MKIKNKLNFILSVACSFVAVCATAFALAMSYLHGKVIYINNQDDFLKIYDNLSARYIVNADTGINITVPWVPIGTEEKPFTGYIDFNHRNIILSKGYDTNYISNSSENGIINLGLFGVNKGTIRNVVLQDPKLSSSYDWDKIENNVKINYGSVCAINNGILSQNRTNIKEIKFGNNFGETNIGGICGINNGEISACSTLGHFSVTSNSFTNVGSVCAIMNKGARLNYCYKDGYAFYTLDYPNSNAGYCVGLCKGGVFSNIGLSYGLDNNSKDIIRLNSSHKSSLVYCGVLIGKIEAEEDIKIENVVCDFKLETYLDNLFFGFISGKVFDNNFNIYIKNACFSGIISNSTSSSANKAGLIFGEYEKKENAKIENLFYYSLENGFLNFDYFGFQESNFNNLTLDLLQLDKDFWIKGNFHFYLNYEEVKNI